MASFVRRNIGGVIKASMISSLSPVCWTRSRATARASAGRSLKPSQAWKMRRRPNRNVSQRPQNSFRTLWLPQPLPGLLVVARNQPGSSFRRRFSRHPYPCKRQSKERGQVRTRRTCSPTLPGATRVPPDCFSSRKYVGTLLRRRCRNSPLRVIHFCWRSASSCVPGFSRRRRTRMRQWDKSNSSRLAFHTRARAWTSWGIAPIERTVLGLLLPRIFLPSDRAEQTECWT